MNKKLIMIDIQNDFVTGVLGTKEAQQMLPRLMEKAGSFQGEILMTQDTHFENYLETQEGKLLPVSHCIKGTKGWELVPELEELRQQRKAKVYQKSCFGSIRLAEDLKAAYEEGQLDGVELAGLCTDICVVSNALLIKAFLPEIPVIVDAGCCAGVTVEKHMAALEVMRSCQVIIW
ncbi:MAG: cysteine hydrolase [Eubacterium sp.]|nr:cysteine hydrolase [Eubacterium sp.]